jgi:hypothetical protein
LPKLKVNASPPRSRSAGQAPAQGDEGSRPPRQKQARLAKRAVAEAIRVLAEAEKKLAQVGKRKVVATPAISSP